MNFHPSPQINMMVELYQYMNNKKGLIICDDWIYEADARRAERLEKRNYLPDQYGPFFHTSLIAGNEMVFNHIPITAKQLYYSIKHDMDFSRFIHLEELYVKFELPGINIIPAPNITLLVIQYNYGDVENIMPLILPEGLKRLNIVIDLNGRNEEEPKKNLDFAKIFGLKLPSNLEYFIFHSRMHINILGEIEYPNTLKFLYMFKCYISSMKCPVNLEYLGLHYSDIVSPDWMLNLPLSIKFIEIKCAEMAISQMFRTPLPIGLEFLSIKKNGYSKKIRNLPPGLKYLACQPCNVEWSSLPDTLKIIDFRGSNPYAMLDKIYNYIITSPQSQVVAILCSILHKDKYYEYDDSGTLCGMKLMSGDTIEDWEECLRHFKMLVS